MKPFLKYLEKAKNNKKRLRLNTLFTLLIFKEHDEEEFTIIKENKYEEEDDVKENNLAN